MLRFVTSLAIWLFLIANALSHTNPQDRASEDHQEIDKVPVAELVELLDTAERSGWRESGNDFRFEAILIELIRRKDNSAAKLLREKLEQFAKRLPKEKKRLEELEDSESKENEQQLPSQYALVDRLQNNLELVTAHHRILGRPDPLSIEVVIPKGGIVGQTRKLPAIAVGLKNVNVDKQPVWIKHGGNYRSGRLARWRIHVWDANGNRVPYRNWSGGMGGGIYSEGFLDFGESWETKLRMDPFVDITQPGKYQVQLFYHNDVTIGHLEETKEWQDLIVFQSNRFEIQVQKGPFIHITADEESDQQTRNLIEDLNDADPLRMVYGEYTSDDHRFLDPDSPQGRLRKMGLRAVPAMLQAIDDKQLSKEKRAWLFALLHSAIDEDDLSPFGFDKAVGDYELRFPGGQSSCTGAEIDVQEQLNLVSKWQAFASAYIKVKPRDAVSGADR